MHPACPNCGGEIAGAEIKVQTDMAYCRGCQHAYRLSELVSGIGPLPGMESPTLSPPPGCWYRETANGWEAGATTRSWGALFFAPFTIAWVLLTVGGTIGEAISGKRPVILTLLDGTPFFFGGVILIAFTVGSVAGCVKVECRADEISIFTGVGDFGWKRRVELGPETKISIPTQLRSECYMAPITLQATQTIKFGSMLTSVRQAFLARVIAAKLRDSALSG